MIKHVLLWCLTAFVCPVWAQTDYTISGYIADAKTGESLLGVNIHCKDLQIGTNTNSYGFYSLQLPEGDYELIITNVGYEKKHITVHLHSNTSLNVKLEVTSYTLEAVGVRGKKNDKKETQAVQSTEMGKVSLPVALMKKVPAFAGEVDIIKVLQLTPGVKRGAEGTINTYVRGGGADQNLVLLDEATVYNAGHLLGFFSVFNSNAIKDVNLYKSAFPAQYGGRLSSVMDIRMKEGNLKKFQGEGSLGIISSSLTLQGPIKRDTSSFIISARRTYLDQLLKLSGQSFPYHFYDLNGKINYIVNKKNRLYLSSYYGNDILKTNKKDESLTGLSSNSALGNFIVSARWNHRFRDPKLFVNTTLCHTQFKYEIGGKTTEDTSLGSFSGNSILVKSSIKDIALKVDFSYNYNAKNEMAFGGNIINHAYRPNVISTTGTVSDYLRSRQGNRILNQELAVYFNNDYTYNDKWKFNYGTRLSGAIVPKSFYSGIEPRASFRYAINKTNSIKGGYARMKQYMHLVSSSSVALPTDLWYPVTNRIKPEVSDQVSLGYYKSFEKHGLLFSAETYYKWMKNLLEYREGAVLILNDQFESELLSGKGTAYGTELFLQKAQGRFSGWIGYALSWSRRQFDSLNEGHTYYARQDRRHDISIVASYDITKRITFSAVWVYSSGNPFTPRNGQFLMPNPSFTGVNILPLYTPRNSVRLSASHRLDVDLVIKRKPTRKWQGEWHISAYNVYNRTQPARITARLDPNTGKYHYQQTGLFGIIPSIAYNFKF